jgi:hypothetical protein
MPDEVEPSCLNERRAIMPVTRLNPMSLRRLTIVLLLLTFTGALAHGQGAPQPAAALMGEVIANELADRAAQRRWIYQVVRRENSQTLTEEQVDTKDGSLYRLLAIDGTPLNPEQRRQDDARIERFLHDPIQQLKSRSGHDGDEQRLEKLLGIMPEAFLYDYDGVEGNLVRLKFRANPNYNPPTFEARVVHSLAGTILIDSQQKRLAKVSGRLISRVDFGYGFFGHIDQGGTIEIGRIQVSPSRWKTALVKLQLSGRFVFFKTINKQEYETRSDFRALPGDPTLSEASRILAR